MNEKIGKRVQDARLQACMTQELLAEKVNTSISIISRLETGRSMVSISRLNDIAQELGICLTDLLCDFSSKKPEDASLDEELRFHISLMNPSQKRYLLEYIKLYENHHEK